MLGRHPELTDRVALEIEFDQYHCLLADHPAVVAWLDGHHLRRLVFDHAAVGVFDMDFAAGEEARVRVHAAIGADDRLHRLRPPEPGRIDHALDARRARRYHLEAHTADFAGRRALDRRQ